MASGLENRSAVQKTDAAAGIRPREPRPSSLARRLRSQSSQNDTNRACTVLKRKRCAVFDRFIRSYCFTSCSTRARVSHGSRGSRPAKNWLYSTSRRLISDSSRRISRSKSLFWSDIAGGRQGSNENHTSGSQSSRAYGIGRSSISTSVRLSAATRSNSARRLSASFGRSGRDAETSRPIRPRDTRPIPGPWRRLRRIPGHRTGRRRP